MDLHERLGNRIPGFDYASEGAYFVTICVRHRRNLFGSIRDGELRLTRVGRIVKECWRQIGVIHSGGVLLDRFVVMPDHVHGIIILGQGVNSGRTGRSLSSIVGGFKAASARRIHARFAEIGPIWQRSFHDRIIRSDREFAAIRWYIEQNPARWIDARKHRT